MVQVLLNSADTVDSLFSYQNGDSFMLEIRFRNRDTSDAKRHKARVLRLSEIV